jgi:hypothetical protein
MVILNYYRVVPAHIPSYPSLPSPAPSLRPSKSPTAEPSLKPTKVPTVVPTSRPSYLATNPSLKPKPVPTVRPYTRVPTLTRYPSTSLWPSRQRSHNPSPVTFFPRDPTGQPTMHPTVSTARPSPSNEPTTKPASSNPVVPTTRPSVAPTSHPTVSALSTTATPSMSHINAPVTSKGDSMRPTSAPTTQPLLSDQPMTLSPNEVESTSSFVAPTGTPSRHIESPSAQLLSSGASGAGSDNPGGLSAEGIALTTVFTIAFVALVLTAVWGVSVRRARAVTAEKEDPSPGVLDGEPSWELRPDDRL